MYLFACKNKSNLGTYNKSIAKQESCVYSSLVCCLVQLLVPHNLYPNSTSQTFRRYCQFPLPPVCVQSGWQLSVQRTLHICQQTKGSWCQISALTHRHGWTSRRLVVVQVIFFSLYKGSFNTFFAPDNRFSFLWWSSRVRTCTGGLKIFCVVHASPKPRWVV